MNASLALNESARETRLRNIRRDKNEFKGPAMFLSNSVVCFRGDL